MRSSSPTGMRSEIVWVEGFRLGSRARSASAQPISCFPSLLRRLPASHSKLSSRTVRAGRGGAVLVPFDAQLWLALAPRN